MINYELQDIYIHDPDIQESRSYTQEYRSYVKYNVLDIYSMDNIQLYHIDNEINKVDEMKEGDVIYKNGVELLVVLSYDHNEPCKGCFFYEDKACGSERLIKCWDCKKEYIFTAIRKYNTTELCGIVKRYEETYKIILKTIKKIEKECQKYVIWDTVHVMLKDDGELIIKALSKDKSVLLNDFIIYINNNGSIDEEDYELVCMR